MFLCTNQTNLRHYNWPLTNLEKHSKHCVLPCFQLCTSSLQGKTFSIWKLNDLHNLEVFVSLLLFHEVHRELWKTDPGTVIGLLNPNPMKQKDGYDGVSRHFKDPMYTYCQIYFSPQTPVEKPHRICFPKNS